MTSMATAPARMESENMDFFHDSYLFFKGFMVEHTARSAVSRREQRLHSFPFFDFFMVGPFLFEVTLDMRFHEAAMSIFREIAS